MIQDLSDLKIILIAWYKSVAEGLPKKKKFNERLFKINEAKKR